MLSNQLNNGRSIVIPINKNIPTASEESPKSEYSLKQNLFDPSKSSPPNLFMMKLHMRMAIYNDTSYLVTNDDNLDNE
jgi:hypothetical protein